VMEILPPPALSVTDTECSLLVGVGSASARFGNQWTMIGDTSARLSSHPHHDRARDKEHTPPKRRVWLEPMWDLGGLFN
jgi:hypothetical protein